MSYGCERPTHGGAAWVWALSLLLTAVGINQLPALAGDGGLGPLSSASARIRVVVPPPAVRAAVAERCAEPAAPGYVPVVRVDADVAGVPDEGQFVRCPSGARVFLLPSGG